MKKFILFGFAVFAGLAVNAQEIILSQTTGGNTQNGVSCPGGDNYWFRNYEPLSSYGVTGNVNLLGVEFGAETIAAAETFEVFAWNAEDAGFPYNFDATDMPEPIAAGMIDILPADAGVLVKAYFNVPVTVDTAAGIVIGVYQVNTGNQVYLIAGSGETAESYIMSENCGLSTPETMTNVGFPDAYHVINLIVEEAAMGVTDINTQSLSVYPNPTSGILNVVLPSDAKVKSTSLVNTVGVKTNVTYDNGKMNLTALPTGVYFLQVVTDKGTFNRKVVKK